MLESVHSFCMTFFCSSLIGYGLTKNGISSFNFKCTSMNGQVPISSLRLKMSVNCSTFVRNSSVPFSSNTESLRLSFIQSISVSVMFLLMSSDSNQGYLSSEVDLFVSSTSNSVHVVMHGISVGWIGFSYAKGIGLSVAGVILSWRYWSIGKCFEFFVCTRPLDLALSMPFLDRVKILQWYLKCYGFQCNNGCFLIQFLSV